MEVEELCESYRASGECEKSFGLPAVGHGEAHLWLCLLSCVFLFCVFSYGARQPQPHRVDAPPGFARKQPWTLVDPDTLQTVTSSMQPLNSIPFINKSTQILHLS